MESSVGLVGTHHDQPETKLTTTMHSVGVIEYRSDT